MPIVEAVLLITVVLGAFAGIERLSWLQRVTAPLRRAHFGADVLWYFVALGAAVASTVIIQPALAWLSIDPLRERIDALPLFASVLVAVVLFDATTFAIHVVLHRVDWLWNFHKIHHSSLHLDWLATTRTHMFEHLVRNAPAQAVLLAVGFGPSTISLAVGVYLIFAVFGHSNLRSPNRLVEVVFVTPRLHFLHHVPATTQNNFGTVLTIWDRAFGRLTTTDAADGARLGVPDEVDAFPQRFTAAVRYPITQLKQAESI